MHPAERYANDVLSGRQIAGNYIRLACQRYESDITSGHKRGLSHDPEAAQLAIDFFSLLTPSKGDFTAIDLMDWEQFALWNLFGWKNAEGYRRFREFWLEVARKNGKSAIGSGAGLYMLTMDGERGAEVYSVGVDRGQSRVVFDEAVAMVDASPDLQQIVKKAGQQEKNVQRLFCPETKSFFEPCSRDAKKKQGYNVHCAVVDEVHVHDDNGEMIQAMRYGMRFRKQPMLFQITTAGQTGKPTVCSRAHNAAVKVLEGINKDDSMFALIYSLDKEDDWEREENWAKSNPSIGVLVTEDTLRQETLTAKNDPGTLNAFKRYALNMWVDADQARIPIHLWDACLEEEVDLEAVLTKDRPCFIDLDLAYINDITSLIALFPPYKADPKYRFLQYHFVPENNIEERVKKDRVNYDIWARDGLLIKTPGDTTDHEFVKEKIFELTKKYNVKEVGYDPALCSLFIQYMQASGYPVQKMVEFKQRALQVAAGIKELVRLVLRKDIAQDGNPVMRWMVSNLVTRTGPTGLEFYDKDRSTEKIDGVVALIMALARAISPENAIKPTPTRLFTVLD